MAKFREIKPVKIILRKMSRVRHSIYTGLGFLVSNGRKPVCFPTPDTQDPYSMLGGATVRFCGKPPQNKYRTRFRLFVAEMIKYMFEPLTQSDVLTVEEWLKEHKSYTQKQKDEILDAWKKCGGTLEDFLKDKRNYDVKGFGKVESYPDFKAHRCINARVNQAKAAFGPYIQAVEKKCKWAQNLMCFIKNVPVADRPAFIRDKLRDYCVKYFASDFTAFEAHFTKEVMEDTTMQLYDYMFGHLQESRVLHRLVRILTKTNHIIFKWFSLDIEATRMSGEMDTSLANTFSNIIMFMFFLEEHGVKDYAGVFEGDDSLMKVRMEDLPSSEEFLDYGMIVKPETHDRSAGPEGIRLQEDEGDYSFCGNVYDGDDVQMICDPIKKLIMFGWVDFKFHGLRRGKGLSLLRMKALSLMHQYPACPILNIFCSRVLSLTKHIDMRWVRNRRLDAYATEMRDHVPSSCSLVEPTFKTRMLMERVYGISVDRQLAIEEQMKSLSLCHSFYISELEDIIPEPSNSYSDTYIDCEVLTKPRDFDVLAYHKNAGSKLQGHLQDWVPSGRQL